MTKPAEIKAADGQHRDLRDALGCFATGVCIVTTGTPDGPVGMTINSFSSVSLEPPLVLWSAKRQANRFPAFESATHFALHVLAREQEALCRLFTSKDAGFDALEHHIDAHGVPQIGGVLARFDCVTEAQYPGGDHLIIVGRVQQFVRRPGQPLVFAQGRFGGLGA